MSAEAPLMLAVDGGGSKTDVALLDLAGVVIARSVGPPLVPHVVGVAGSLDGVLGLATQACEQSGIDATRLRRLGGTALYLAGIDLPEERAAYRAAARDRVGGPLTVDNDVLAVLHAGAPDGWGLALTCGTGANGVAVRPDGTTERYLALGELTGDRAGGQLLGRHALLHAARSEDGRGPRTALERLVPAHFGMATATAAGVAFHHGTLAPELLSTLVPVVMAAARDGDEIAGRLLDDLADELAIMVTALARRSALGVDRLPVVLGGGVLQAPDTRVLTRLIEALNGSLPGAAVRVLDRPPVAGAAAAALRVAGVPPRALESVRRADWGSTLPNGLLR